MQMTHAALAITLLATSAAAQETYRFTLTTEGQSSSTFTPLSGDLQLWSGTNTQELVEYTAEHPSYVPPKTWTCNSSFVIVRGIPSGEGHCLMENVDGDRSIIATSVTHVSEGRNAGTWYSIGGTGAQEGVQSRGTYYSIYSPASGRIITTVEGQVTLNE
ncbi:MAG: hypothetical protein COB65_11825 [Thalassobium sp.]|nr:MAG: hypothetical protein COB65_11825 [Thalassobium sp.]|tara:strand:+ start:561 stop:1040 length:480 start_codon:yes stop_codon:yes gene_type:complete